MGSFILTKWYLDCVEDDGRLTVLYWARTAWKRAAITCMSVLSADRDGVASTIAVSNARPPRFADGVLRFDARDISVEIRGRAPSSAALLLATADGSVDWNCAIPCGEVTLRRGRSVLHGLGYAECLQLSIAPWKLPIDELRWGRFTSESGSMAWIDWRGAEPLTVVLRDGATVSGGEVTDSRIRAGDLELDLSEERLVRDASLGATLQAIPAVHSLLPDRLLSASEKKWCNRSTLRRGADVVAEGWTVHERVRFR